MVRTLLWVAVAVVAAWFHRPGATSTPAGIRRAFLLFAAGLVGWRLLDLAAPGLGNPSVPVVAARIALALALWTATMTLLACDARVRDRWTRLITIGLGIVFAAAVSAGLGYAFAASGIIGFRWRTRFDTRPTAGLALTALVLVVLTAWPIPAPAAKGAASPLAGFFTWTHAVAATYLVYGFVAAAVRVIRDPSLGIRTVSRRLALSHVLVVGVPLVLVGCLWLATTVLGVNADRAMVATRAIEAEGDALASGLELALAAPGGAEPALAVWTASEATRWPRLSVWTRRDSTWRLALGPGIAGADTLRGWPDSLGVLPASGLVALGDSVILGAAARGAGTVSAAIAIAPSSALLTGMPRRIAGADIVLYTSVVRTSRGGVSVGGSQPRRGPVAVTSDTVKTSGNVTLSAGGETYVAGKRGTSFWQVITGGYSNARGIARRNGRWEPAKYLVSTRLDPASAVMGLRESARQNPIGILPLVLLSLLTALVVTVVGFDLLIVTNMGRSITTAIRALRGGTERLQAGDLAHRIAVEGHDDLWDVAGAFNDAATGLERARVIEQERNRFESELSVARQIHARLLPAAPPAVPGLEIAGLSESAREVGGDYYDHIDLGDGRVLLVVADVSGKGVPAALLMSGFRASLTSQELHATGMADLGGRLNDFVVRSVDPGKFITAFLAVLDGRDGRLEYVNAGHNPPVLLRPDGTHESLVTGGLILGVLAGTPFERGIATLAPGDLVVLYTDGVTEGTNADDELWGDERLLASLRRRAHEPVATLVAGIAAEVRAFEGERGPADDITLLAARRVTRA